jgi:hypothetical protein
VTGGVISWSEQKLTVGIIYGGYLLPENPECVGDIPLTLISQYLAVHQMQQCVMQHRVMMYLMNT